MADSMPPRIWKKPSLVRPPGDGEGGRQTGECRHSQCQPGLQQQEGMIRADYLCSKGYNVRENLIIYI